MKTYFFKFFIPIFFVTIGFSQPLYLSDFQYFSESELSGGGPYTGSPVSFWYRDTLDGFVHTNGNLILSNFGCPQFYGYVRAVNGITAGSCIPDNVFQGGFDADADSFFLPTPEIVDDFKNYANYVFIADSMINRTDIRDTLIMTEIEFQPGGFVVNQWSYIIPPIADDDTQFNDFGYYHNHANNSIEKCEIDGFHNFDFPSPDFFLDYILYNQLYMTTSGIIHIQGGQLLVKGIVDGQFVIVTDERTEYLRPDDSGILDYCYNNIWLTDDLTYLDSDTMGQVSIGSVNRLGLVSGANIIIANTLENGGRNSLNGSDIRINAALITLNGSFTAHYWQNTTSQNYAPDLQSPAFSKGDGRGPYRMGGTTGSSDSRGNVYLWGTLVQNKRGFMRRGQPGPYESSGIGYEGKIYHYDPNFLVSPPPGFEELVNPLNLFQYGDVNLSRDIDDSDATMILESLVGSVSLDNIQILNANVSLDYTVSALDATIIYQYNNGLLDSLPVDASIHFGEVGGSVSMDDGEITEGEEVILPINVNGAGGIFALSGVITYDPAYLEYVGVTWPTIFSHNATSFPTIRSEIKIAAATTTEVEGDVTIATVTFVAQATLPGNQTSVSLASLRWNEEDELNNAALATLQNVTSVNSNFLAPNEYTLYQNHPNPFNPTTTISYDLPEQSMIKLTVFDILGQEVATLQEAEKPPGNYEVQWNGLNQHGNPVSTGVYFCRLQAGNYSKTIKMVYLR